jgi:CDGSH-type Zn-finger protein/uncharacterized Fe-S cluster protein YjdI
MGRKIRHYEAEGNVVEFEAARCIHAEECVHGLPKVFDVEARPWIQPGNGSPDTIADTVARCPTGALQYRDPDGRAAEEAPAENTVRVIPNGPLYVAGRLRLQLSGGEVLEDSRMALCRCGASKNKPFCDNAHLEMNFSDSGIEVEHRVAPSEDSANPALTVTLAPNGPILLEGPLRVVTADDASTGGGKGAFCRCGSSGSKPYCDGSHAGAGFLAD